MSNDEAERARKRQYAEALGAFGPPVFIVAPPASSAWHSGWGGAPGAPNRIHVRQKFGEDDLEVDTETERFASDDLRVYQLLTAHINALRTRGRLEFPIKLEVERETVPLQTFAGEIEFRVLVTDRKWLGVARVGDRTLQIEAPSTVKFRDLLIIDGYDAVVASTRANSPHG
jgi:hypothetical protein